MSAATLESTDVADAEEARLEAAIDAKTKAPRKAKATAALFDLSSIIPIEKPRPMSDKFSAIVYGGKGVGKTSLIATLADVPELSPVLVIATEDGSSVLSQNYADDPNLDVVFPETWPDVAKIVSAVADNETKYKSVVLDTIAESQEFMKTFRTNDGQTNMEFQDWGYVADQTIKVVKMLHRSEYVNAIFTTHTEKVKDDDSGKVLTSPYFLGKKALQEALKPIDLVLYLAVAQDKTTKETVRVLQTQPDGKFDASDRSGKLDFQIPNPSFTEIYAQLTA